jgi:hypothetical protein
VQAESDVVKVVNACNGEDMWWSCSCLCGVPAFMAVIGKVIFIHCSRETNKVPHNMARFCFDLRTSCNRVDDPLAVS